jgi:hypothetical protein
MSDLAIYIFCAIFFVLGFLLCASWIVTIRRNAVNNGRMIIKSGDEWKGTIQAFAEVAEQLSKAVKPVLKDRNIEKEKPNVRK